MDQPSHKITADEDTIITAAPVVVKIDRQHIRAFNNFAGKYLVPVADPTDHTIIHAINTVLPILYTTCSNGLSTVPIPAPKIRSDLVQNLFISFKRSYDAAAAVLAIQKRTSAPTTSAAAALAYTTLSYAEHHLFKAIFHRPKHVSALITRCRMACVPPPPGFGDATQRQTELERYQIRRSLIGVAVPYIFIGFLRAIQFGYHLATDRVTRHQSRHKDIGVMSHIGLASALEQCDLTFLGIGPNRSIRPVEQCNEDFVDLRKIVILIFTAALVDSHIVLNDLDHLRESGPVGEEAGAELETMYANLGLYGYTMALEEFVDNDNVIDDCYNEENSR